jgi:hypothetical protein
MRLVSFIINFKPNTSCSRLYNTTSSAVETRLYLIYWLTDWVWWVRLWLRPPTGLLFIPQMYVSMECHVDDDAGCSWLVHQSSLAVLPAETSGPSRKNDEGVRILPISIWNTTRDLEHAVKSYDMGPPALLPVRRKVCCGCLSPLKIHRLGRVWTREPWVQ